MKQGVRALYRELGSSRLMIRPTKETQMRVKPYIARAREAIGSAKVEAALAFAANYWSK